VSTGTRISDRRFAPSRGMMVGEHMRTKREHKGGYESPFCYFLFLAVPCLVCWSNGSSQWCNNSPVSSSLTVSLYELPNPTRFITLSIIANFPGCPRCGTAPTRERRNHPRLRPLPSSLASTVTETLCRVVYLRSLRAAWPCSKSPHWRVAQSIEQRHCYGRLQVRADRHPRRRRA
jgi:hypothetical protein